MTAETKKGKAENALSLAGFTPKAHWVEMNSQTFEQHHKKTKRGFRPGCTRTEDDKRLEIWNFESRGIVLSAKNKDADLQLLRS